MHYSLLPYPQVPQLAKTDVAYAIDDPKLRPFYQYPAQLSALPALIAGRQTRSYPRADVVAVLHDQYRHLPPQAATTRNIEALLHPDTYTVITAHQPSLFLGPLYFLYKALTTINLAEQAEAYLGGKNRIVPVFVLGSEDHDLEELNSTQLYGKHLQWASPETGAVGSMSTQSLTPVLTELRTILGESPAAQAVYARVERAYTQSSTIAEATQAMLHDLFGAYGLLVLNMNDARLKRHFVPVLQDELLHQTSQRLVSDTIADLQAAGFKAQAAPRDINLFYLQPGSRERIAAATLPDGSAGYQVLNTDRFFSRSEMLAELEAHPEHFSPNVVLRPLYQDMVLPNLAYVGGGGELAYWLERKAQFAHYGVPYPMLVRRNSALWVDAEAGKKLNRLGFSAAQFFGDTESLVKDFVSRHAAGEVSLSAEISDLRRMYEALAQKATAIDPTLEKAVRAEEVKAAAGLEQWQSRLVRAEKQKHEVALNQLRALKEKLFPANGLQERTDNFMPYLIKYGDAFVTELKAAFQPLEPGFVILLD